MRILVADDNYANRLVARHILEREGHMVIYAENGEIAVEKCRVVKFDLILMDIMMPIMDGIEALTAIRQLDGPNQTTPIFALTAYCGPNDRVIYTQAGFEIILTKPLRRGDLETAVQHYQRENHPEKTSEGDASLSGQNWQDIKSALRTINRHLPKAMSNNQTAVHILCESALQIKNSSQAMGLPTVSAAAARLREQPSALTANLCALLEVIERTHEHPASTPPMHDFSGDHSYGANAQITQGRTPS